LCLSSGRGVHKCLAGTPIRCVHAYEWSRLLLTRASCGTDKKVGVVVTRQSLCVTDLAWQTYAAVQRVAACSLSAIGSVRVRSGRT
jgi:hypothetical protein